MTLIDTHCHLAASEFAEDRAETVAAAKTAGVVAFVVPAVEVGNFQAVSDCCTRFAGCAAAYGIHPLYVQGANDQDLAILYQHLSTGASEAARPVAVGEIGLDGFARDSDLARQEWFFVEQLKIARSLDLPVLLHVRRAIDQVLWHLRRIRVRGGIAHAFSGSGQQADTFIKLGFKLGFGGAITHPRATRLRALAASLPLSSLVLETDAPDMPPAWLVGCRNSPEQLPRINAVLAQVRQMVPEELAAETSANAFAVLSELRLPV